MKQIETSILKCENLTKRFNGITAVNNISLKFNKSNIIGLMGNNGSGKTTLLNILCGLVEFDSGHIQYLEQNMCKIKPNTLLSKGIARSFQLIRNFPNISLIENLLLSHNSLMTYSIFSSLWNRKKNKLIEKQIWEDSKELFKFFNMEYFAQKEEFHKKMSEFSIGEQRIVEIFRVFLSNPKLILFDEPSVGLSDELTIKLIEYIKIIAEKGCSFLIVSHDYEFLCHLTDKIYFMKNGEFISSECITTNTKGDIFVKN